MARTTRLENRDETTRRRNVVTNVKFKRQSVLSSTLVNAGDSSASDIFYRQNHEENLLNSTDIDLNSK